MATVTAPLESLRPLAVPSPATSIEVKPVTIGAPAPSTIDELIKLRASEPEADEPIIAYPNNDIDYIYYTPRQLNDLVEQVAVHYSKFIPQRISSSDPVQVVGLLGPSDLDYLITLLAVTRLGHTVLFLSTRISEDAVVSLIQATKATTLLFNESYRALAAGVQERIGASTGLIYSPNNDSPSTSVEKQRLPPHHLDGTSENKHVCWIIHSSGSTGHPKPIFQTHSGALRNYANNFGLRGYITLPLYHAHGISCVFRAIHSRKIIYMYCAKVPLTAHYLLATLQEHREIRVLYAVPYALKLLSESQDGLATLKDLDLVMFGGSACPKPIGDKLTQNGVLLVSHYGTTETGQLMTSFRDRSDTAWDYLRAGPELRPFLRMEERSPGIYELCVLPGWPSKVASNRDDDSYATKDLFEPHPTIPNAWRYYARLDDTLVLENGEKVNPLLIEDVARDNPNVTDVVAFGANKPYVGVFLVPAKTSTVKSDEELVDLIWPAIDACNEKMPAYARIMKEMIKVLPSTAQYRTTDKGTVIRSAFYRDFADQIEDAYRDDSVNENLPVIEGPELLAHLRQLLTDVVGGSGDVADVKDDTDLFSLGIDSLQSLKLRISIMKTVNLAGTTLPQNFVFENPSLQAMASALTRLRLGQGTDVQPDIETRMTALIEKYGTFDQSAIVKKTNSSDVVETSQSVLLTGATGSLGAHIVSQLALSPKCKAVYCLVRSNSKESAAKRVRQSLQARNLYHTLSATTQRKIVALPADTTDPQLGLSEETYTHMISQITHVIHCAWSVNFNMTLESFSDCIAGTRHLLDFCLTADRPNGAAFAFCSSVSTTARTPGNSVPEALPESLSYAQNMGYAQSKLVTEHVVRRAAQQTGLTARVLRIGQIIADTRYGIWNASEAIPMTFQTAETINALPKLDELVSWTPVDIIASSVIDLTLAPPDSAVEVVNITNPTLIHWMTDLLPLLHESGLKFDELPAREWVDKLRHSEQDPVANPPIKLLEFFASKYDNDNPPTGRRVFETSIAQAHASSLRQAGAVSKTLVERFVNYFRTSCWVTPLATTEKQERRSVIFLTGPCGSGKSTVGVSLAEKLGLPLIEGDDIHTRTARQKMHNLQPLDDADRFTWLAHIRGAVADRIASTGAPGAIVTCSALRKTYRDELRKLSELFKEDVEVIVRFIFLDTGDDSDALMQRLHMRQGHYMKPEMVKSQIEILEQPTESESDMVPVNAKQNKEAVLKEVEEIVREILE
ncbi:hypothetical protein ZTR_08387 [Talaromyces verruculosus]|nr:hypothetical protein ZTR_08387 [Talaromyces verruculosus]